MTSAIQSSLGNLNRAIQKLEMTAVDLETAQKAQPKKSASSQNDLFAFPSSASSNNVDAAALASRLDGAIAKVERLLKEGDTTHG